MKIIVLLSFLSTLAIFAAPSDQKLVARRDHHLGAVKAYNTVYIRDEHTQDDRDADTCDHNHESRTEDKDKEYGGHAQQSSKGSTNNDQVTSLSPPPSSNSAQSSNSNSNQAPATKPVQLKPPTVNVPADGGVPSILPQLAFGSNVTGHITMYGNGDGNACGYPVPDESSDIFPIAIGASIFGKGEACGACLEVNPGPYGIRTKVHVADDCPECDKSVDATIKTWHHMFTNVPPGKVNSE
ncbi:hypothetical protein CBS101457_002856 [Exobasidium rhododendri]|nr:hypothetical protein CBS101457_002856 [Exobasidium rhododendri]